MLEIVFSFLTLAYRPPYPAARFVSPDAYLSLKNGAQKNQIYLLNVFINRLNLTHR
ncbi:hypothetical protein NTGBS_170026 [Candidatus Nitrotoga sp. BS]|nr:hypothetical protein NTGBS_170026 [Candidatus Nitrotoga sp. BS]